MMKIDVLNDYEVLKSKEAKKKWTWEKSDIGEVVSKTQIITDGEVKYKSKPDSQIKNYENVSYYYDTKTTRYSLKDYTFAIVFSIEQIRNRFEVYDKLINVSIYLKDINDKNSLKQAKKVINNVKKINKLYRSFSLCNLIGENSQEFSFEQTDENVYSVKKKINKKIKFNKSDLYLVKTNGDNKTNYFLCTFNSYQDYYNEVLTDTIIRAEENIEIYYLPTLLNKFNLNIQKTLNYYELIYFYNKLRTMCSDYYELGRYSNVATLDLISEVHKLVNEEIQLEQVENGKNNLTM